MNKNKKNIEVRLMFTFWSFSISFSHSSYEVGSTSYIVLNQIIVNMTRNQE